MDDFKEFVVLMGSLILGILLFSLFTFTGISYYEQWQCNTFSSLSGKESKYVFYDTCYVKHNGQYMRYSEYEKRAIAKDLKGVFHD